MTTLSSIVIVKNNCRVSVEVALTEDDLNEEGYLVKGRGIKFSTIDAFKRWSKARSGYLVQHFALNPDDYIGGADITLKDIKLSKVISALANANI